MTKRIRIETPALGSWEEADQALRRIGEIDIESERIEGRLQEKINTAKTKAGTDLKPLADEKKVLVKQLQQFAEAHRDDFGKKKSRRLVFGELGWRASSRLKKLLSPVETIERLRRLLLPECVRVREEPDVEAIKKLPEVYIEAVGCKLERRDDFFLEPDREKVAEYLQ